MNLRLKNILKLAWSFELMDVGNSFFMTKFDCEEDRAKVFNDHYLAVSQWSTDFVAS